MSAGRLLLVDDEPDIRAIAKLALEGVGGWEVTAAGSASEAVAAVQAAQPDVVLLDGSEIGSNGFVITAR